MRRAPAGSGVGRFAARVSERVAPKRLLVAGAVVHVRAAELERALGAAVRDFAVAPERAAVGVDVHRGGVERGELDVVHRREAGRAVAFSLPRGHGMQCTQWSFRLSCGQPMQSAQCLSACRACTALGLPSLALGRPPSPSRAPRLRSKVRVVAFVRVFRGGDGRRRS